MLDTQEVKTLIRRELPLIIQTDEEIRDFIQDLFRKKFAPKAETESRFDRILDELRRDREEQSRLWYEQNKKQEEDRREKNKKQ